MSERINDGGPVYPTQRENCEKDWGETGMTLRDHFASQALPMLISVCVNDDKRVSYEDHVAINAYLMADAMLRARESS